MKDMVVLDTASDLVRAREKCKGDRMGAPLTDVVRGMLRVNVAKVVEGAAAAAAAGSFAASFAGSDLGDLGLVRGASGLG